MTWRLDSGSLNMVSLLLLSHPTLCWLGLHLVDSILSINKASHASNGLYPSTVLRGENTHPHGVGIFSVLLT